LAVLVGAPALENQFLINGKLMGPPSSFSLINFLEHHHRVFFVIHTRQKLDKTGSDFFTALVVNPCKLFMIS
jgi:hypothetical protein